MPNETKPNQETAIRRQIWRLYDTTEALDDLYDDTAGEVTDETEALEAFLEDSSDETLEALGAFVREVEARIAAVKLEASRLAAVKARQEKRKAWAVDLVRTMLVARGLVAGKRGGNALEAGTFRLSLNVSPPRLEGEGDPALLDDRFVREIPASRDVDKKAIAAALKSGEDVEGFELVRGADRVGIK